MFSTFDLCLLLYVIRLAGWLKHCNLSLSLRYEQQKTVLISVATSSIAANHKTCLAMMRSMYNLPNQQHDKSHCPCQTTSLIGECPHEQPGCSVTIAFLAWEQWTAVKRWTGSPAYIVTNSNLLYTGKVNLAGGLRSSA